MSLTKATHRVLADSSVGTAQLSAGAVTTDKIAPDTVRYSQLASWQTLSASPTLSAEAITPRLVTAYVDFLYSTSSPYVTYQDAYNISSIEKLTGSYGPKSDTLGWRLYFTKPMKNTRFLTFCGDYAGYSVLDSGTGFGESEVVESVVVAAGNYNGYRYRFLFISQYE